MQPEQSGSWEVVNFTKLAKKYKVELRRDDQVKKIYIPLDLLLLKPELFEHRTNLYKWFIGDYRLNNILLEIEKYPLKLILLKYVKSGKIFSRQALYDQLQNSEKYNMSLFDEVYEELKGSNFINEKEAIRSYISYSIDAKRHGKERIIYNLRKRKFNDKLINEVLSEFSADRFYQKAVEEAERIQKHARKAMANRLATQQRVKSKLVNRGFSDEIACQLADEVPFAEEHVYLLNDLERLKRKYRSIAHSRSKYYNKIVNALRRKGYNFYYIDKVFPKNGGEEDDYS